MSEREEILDLPIEEDTELEGIASLAGSIASEDEIEASEDFERLLAENGMRASRSRAGLLDEARRLLRRFRSRRLVADLGSHEVKLDWLGFHVPQGGKGRLVLGSSAEDKALLKLTFMGFGGGARRRVSVSAKRDFGERTSCFYLGSTVPVRILSFAEDGAEEANALQVDVGEPSGNYLRAEEACPLCFGAGHKKPVRAKPTGQGWDLSEDEKGMSETLSYELSRVWQFEVGLEIPLLGSPLKPAIEMSRSFTSSCVASYEFPPGSRFTSYELIGSRLNLPFWGTS